MRGFSISLAALLYGAVTVPLLAAGKPEPAKKTQPARRSAEAKEDLDGDERNHKRKQLAEANWHGPKAGRETNAKSVEEDGHDE